MRFCKRISSEENEKIFPLKAFFSSGANILMKFSRSTYKGIAEMLRDALRDWSECKFSTVQCCADVEKFSIADQAEMLGISSKLSRMFKWVARSMFWTEKLNSFINVATLSYYESNHLEAQITCSSFQSKKS